MSVTKSERDKLADYVSDCYKWSAAFMEPQHRDMLDRYRTFRQVFPGNIGTKSRLFVPKSTALILNMIPRMIGDEPTMRILPRGETPTRNAQSQQLTIDYELGKMDYFMRLYYQAMDAAILGLGLRQNIWWTQIEAIRRRLRLHEIEDLREMGMKVPPYFMDTQVVYDGPWSVDIDTYDYYPDPDHPDPQDMMFCILTSQMSQLEIEELAEEGFFRWVDDYFSGERDMEKRTSQTPERAAERAKDQRNAIAGLRSPNSHYDKAPKALKPHPIVDFWGRVPIGLVPRDIRDAMSRKSRMQGLDFRPKFIKMNIVMSQDKHIFKASPFPYYHNEIPVVTMSIIPVKGQHIGIGLVELMQGLQKYELYRRNNLIDNLNVLGNGMFTKLRSSRIRDYDLVSRAGGTIPVDRHEELKALEFPGAAQIANMYREGSLTEQEWQEASGFSLFSQGRDAPGLNKTASGLAMLVREANTRIALVKRLAEKQSLRADGYQYISMNQQYIRDPVRLMKLGRSEPFEVGPDSLWGDFDVDVKIAPTEPYSQAVERENFLLMMGLLRTSPAAQAYNHQAMDAKLLEIFGQEELVKEVLTPNQNNLLQLLAAGAAQNPSAVSGAAANLTGANARNLAKQFAGAAA